MRTEILTETENKRVRNEESQKNKEGRKCSEEKFNKNRYVKGNRDGNQRTDVLVVILTNVRKASTSLYP